MIGVSFLDDKEYGDELFIYAMALMEEMEEKERQKQKSEEQEGDVA